MEEKNIINIIVELVLVNNNKELRYIIAYNLEQWIFIIRTRLYLEAGGDNLGLDISGLLFAILDIKVLNMLNFV